MKKYNKGDLFLEIPTKQIVKIVDIYCNVPESKRSEYNTWVCFKVIIGKNQEDPDDLRYDHILR